MVVVVVVVEVSTVVVVDDPLVVVVFLVVVLVVFVMAEGLSLFAMWCFMFCWSHVASKFIGSTNQQNIVERLC